MAIFVVIYTFIFDVDLSSAVGDMGRAMARAFGPHEKGLSLHEKQYRLTGAGL
jgi:hypothetical protein